jgi:hypothetical protein
VGLRFFEFADHEWGWIVEGHIKRLELGWQQHAWLASHNYAANGAGKKTPTPDKLLGGAFSRRKQQPERRDPYED